MEGKGKTKNEFVQEVAELYRQVEKLKRSEAEGMALQDIEVHYRRIVATLPGVIYDYIIYLDGSNRFLYLSPLCLKIFEMEAETLMGDPNLFLTVVHPDDINRLIQEHQAAKQECKYVESQIRIITPSGLLKWIQLSSRPSPAPKHLGEAVIWSGLVQDITERKQTEEALRWKTALLEAQVNTSIDGILVVDENNRRIITNRRLMDLWDVPQHILDDEDDTALLRYVVSLTRYPEEFLQKVEHLYNHPYETSRDEIEFKSGMVLDRYSAPVVDEKGHRYGRIWTFHDITERRRAEEELFRSREELRSLADHLSTAREDEKAKIARELHDELGQSLTAMLIELSWLRRKLRKDQQPLADRVEAVATIIKQTMNTVKRIQGELRPWMLDDLGLCATMEWQAKNFTEYTHIPVDLQCNFETIADQKISIALFRIFQEALTNVARHAHATKISAELVQEGGGVRLSISDNGLGIKEGEFRKPLSFGLLGIQERVKAFDGSLSIEGTAGKGTTLCVRIPFGPI